MPVLLANPARIADEVLAAVLAPPPPVDYLAWAERNIVFSERESQFHGPYNRRLFPLASEILRALSPDDPCRVVTLSCSAQVGKTVIATIFTLGSMAMDPADLLYVHPTEDNARRWSKTKLSPMLRGTTCLTRLFPQKSRDVADSVLYKERADGAGAILISGANSPASLSMVSMRRQVQDDLAKWTLNDAGDPEAQADSRSLAHEFAKILKASTPLVMPGCRITKSFQAGSQEYPEVPCPACGHYQVLEWENMQALIARDPDHPEKAHFSCVECDFPIEEHHRPEMIRAVRWVARNPGMMRVHRSFHFWSAYSLTQSWERIARAWLKAKGDPGAEQTFVNDVVGRAYESAMAAPSWETLRDRGAVSFYPRGVVPAGFPLVFVGVDCQGDRVEWQAVAFGRDNRRAVVDCGVIPGHVSEETCRERLSALLRQEWPKQGIPGRRIGIDRLAIDGNAYTEDVWEWARRHPPHQVIMVRGANQDSAQLLVRVRKERNLRTGKLLKYSSRFYTFGASPMKMALCRNLAKTDLLEPGAILFPSGLEDEFYRQLTAERRTPQKPKHGFIEYRWTKETAQANEMLDTHLQAEAAAFNWGLRGLPSAVWDRLEGDRETPPPDAQLSIDDILGGPPRAAEAPAPRPSEPVRNPDRLPEATGQAPPPAPPAGWLTRRKGFLS